MRQSLKHLMNDEITNNIHTLEVNTVTQVKSIVI